MTEKVEAFLLAMLYMGLETGQANNKAYEYALALLRDQERIGSHVSATMMERAVELIREAWTRKEVVRFAQEMLR
jgi:hypothetical protein